MSKKASNLLLLGFFIGFFVIGYISFQDAMPEHKNHRVYELLKPHFPYTIKQRLGGFTIIHKNGQEEKPPASEVFKRVDEIDKQWGISHLKLQENTLLILDDKQQVKAKLMLQNQEEIAWVKQFFRI